MEKEVLPNGARILCQEIDSIRTAALGLWLFSGSRNERREENGISHAIEHMVFKGTQTRSAEVLAQEMDWIGGHTNAFTTKEVTAFTTWVLDSDIPQGAELISDLVFHPSFAESDWETERGVILEEIDMYEDTPEDLVVETLFDAAYPVSAIGRPILGTKDSLEAMTTSQIKTHWSQHYTPENLTFCIAGKYTDADLDPIRTLLSSLKGGEALPETSMEYSPKLTLTPKPIEQNHICIGYPSISVGDPERYALQVMTTILGNGASSRLFQSVREKSGLCYSIYSYQSSFRGGGLYTIYLGTGVELQEKAIQITQEVIERFLQEGPTTEELDRVRRQMKTSVLMGLESTNTRMSFLANSEFALGRIPDFNEIIDAYDAVSLADVRAITQRVLQSKQRSVSIVGHVETLDYPKLFHFSS
jgi:predicted Zn-dependent peptidase